MVRSIVAREEHRSPNSKTFHDFDKSAGLSVQLEGQSGLYEDVTMPHLSSGFSLCELVLTFGDQK